MKNISIEVEVSTGSSILQTCHDMVDLARQLDMCVTADFNGVYMVASPEITGDQLFTEYHKKLDRQLEKPSEEGLGG